MWSKCECGHWRNSHHRNDYTPSGYGGCGICSVCGKTSHDHVFVNHVFQACPCKTYQEEAT